jgi:hypothetical protein
MVKTTCGAKPAASNPLLLHIFSLSHEELCDALTNDGSSSRIMLNNDYTLASTESADLATEDGLVKDAEFADVGLRGLFALSPTQLCDFIASHNILRAPSLHRCSPLASFVLCKYVCQLVGQSDGPRYASISPSHASVHLGPDV